MKVFVNSNNEIKDVNTTEDTALTPIEVPDGFFNEWAVAKICCYKVILNKNKVVGYVPYVDSKIIEHIERLAKKADAISEESAMLSETIDSLLTDIIPSLLG